MNFTPIEKDQSVKEISGRFIDEEVLSVVSLGLGNINDTFIVETGSGKYVLQRIQKKMDPTKLEYNYGLYSKICEQENMLFPKWIRDRDGKFFVSDSDGNSWRMYPYIEGEILSAPLSEAQCHACGEGLGRIHAALKKLPEAPKPVYPHLHDMGYYYEQYVNTLRGDGLCEDSRDADVEEKIRRKMAEISSFDTGSKSVVHGDAKLSNMLFREGKVVGFLDWDTVMEGSVSEEIADCIRSACIKDGKLDIRGAKALIEGYISASRTDEIITDLVPGAFDKICFELALRYYTDAISDNKHFIEKYPGYRLKRAKELLQNKWPES